MKTTIWKFPIFTSDRQVVAMPIGAKILCVQTQNERPCLWAIVQPENKTEERQIEIFGTGSEMGLGFDAHDYNYIGSYQLLNGNFVGHVFEKIENNLPF